MSRRRALSVDFAASAARNHQQVQRGDPDCRTRPHAPSRYGIALATLNDDPGLRPAAHTFVAYKAPWFEITDDLPQYPESRQSRKASPVSDGLLA